MDQVAKILDTGGRASGAEQREFLMWRIMGGSTSDRGDGGLLREAPLHTRTLSGAAAADAVGDWGSGRQAGRHTDLQEGRQTPHHTTPRCAVLHLSSLMHESCCDVRALPAPMHTHTPPHLAAPCVSDGTPVWASWCHQDAGS